MRAAIMQPYFFPYIDYFRLTAAVDPFIVYDNIKYTKKGWVNRNRLLRNGRDAMFSLPPKSGPDYLNICGRELAADFDRAKPLNQMKGAYRRASHFAPTFPLIGSVVRHGTGTCFASCSIPSSAPSIVSTSGRRSGFRPRLRSTMI